jgi:hypothetical protein
MGFTEGLYRTFTSDQTKRCILEYVNLGNTGLKVSRICLGALSFGSLKWRDWVLDEEESIPFYKRHWN